MGAVLAFIPRGETKQAAEARRRAQAVWQSAEQSWRNQNGPQNFSELKSSANSLFAQLRALPVEEARSRADLERKKRESQLNRHLDRFAIKDARIKKIGSGRKAVLASFGVETAADVEAHRIQRIQGFGRR
jgi:DNA-binding helix-hairpin-helix protein with protein kinase domain